MKIIDIIRNKHTGRAYVTIEVDGEKINFAFPHKQKSSHIPYYMYDGTVVPNPNAKDDTNEMDEEFIHYAKQEIGQFLASKIFHEYDMLKNLKK